MAYNLKMLVNKTLCYKGVLSFVYFFAKNWTRYKACTLKVKQKINLANVTEG